MARPAGPGPPRRLSSREREVLDRVALLDTNAEIGAQLGIRPQTVKTHLRHIYRKLDVANRRGAVRWLRASVAGAHEEGVREHPHRAA